MNKGEKLWLSITIALSIITIYAVFFTPIALEWGNLFWVAILFSTSMWYCGYRYGKPKRRKKKTKEKKKLI